MIYRIINDASSWRMKVKDSQRHYIFVIALAALLLLAGCQKKTATAPPPPPPPPPAAPTASISVNPDSIQAGRATQLTWRTENATDVSIDGIGKVDANGSQSVSPTSSATYHLVAKGPGGAQEATARVTVTSPTPAQSVSPSDEQLFSTNVQDIFFDYDSFELRPDAKQQLASDAKFLVEHPNIRFTIEGHCDERGSTEYNLALGDSRANTTKESLIRAGVGADRVHSISYGKEKPLCNESTESCWQQNRRAHFVLQK
jgi:peptidoglycan-associated lipoprotein